TPDQEGANGKTAHGGADAAPLHHDAAVEDAEADAVGDAGPSDAAADGEGDGAVASVADAAGAGDEAGALASAATDGGPPGANGPRDPLGIVGNAGNVQAGPPLVQLL